MDKLMKQLVDGYKIEDFQSPSGDWGCVVTDAEQTFMSVASPYLTREDAIDNAIALVKERKGGKKKNRT
jgi:hypothetical protein